MNGTMKIFLSISAVFIVTVANAANPAAGLYDNQRQKDSSYKIEQQKPSYLKYSQGADDVIRSLDDAKLNQLKQMKESMSNGVCLDKRVLVREDSDIREVGRGYLNGQGQLPESPSEALKDESCKQLDYGKSFLHDFNDNVAQICNASPETRTICYLLAVAEFLGGLPQGTVLNVEGEHNIKIVCDGGEEYVFDKDGRIVESGIDEGTFNLSSPEDWVGHAINDILAAVEKLPAKSSLSREDAIKILDECIRQRRAIVMNAESSTRGLFAGKKSSSSMDVVLAANSASKVDSKQSTSIGDWDYCRCDNPDDSDFSCKKCGKMSAWLAPKHDLEFLQSLNKGAGK